MSLALNLDRQKEGPRYLPLLPNPKEAFFHIAGKLVALEKAYPGNPISRGLNSLADTLINPYYAHPNMAAVTGTGFTTRYRENRDLNGVFRSIALVREERGLDYSDEAVAKLAFTEGITVAAELSLRQLQKIPRKAIIGLLLVPLLTSLATSDQKEKDINYGNGSIDKRNEGITHPEKDDRSGRYRTD